MPVLVESDSHRAQIIMGDLPIGSQLVSSIGHAEQWLDANSQEYAVVLGPEVDIYDATSMADRLRRTHPTVGLTLLRYAPTAEVYSEAMRSGIRFVMPADDRAGLADAISKSRENWEAVHGSGAGAPGRAGKVITIFSPKGGVGKTTVAVNLAEALLGKSRRVCVVDLDLAFGDVAITLQLVPEHTVEETVGFEDHIDFSLLDRLMSRTTEGLAILAAPTSPDGKERITVSLVRAILRTLRNHFDFVVVDTAPGFEDHVLAAFDETDDCVLVATLDVPTVKNVKVAVDTLDMLSLAKESRHLVLNRADDEVGLTADNVEGILKMPVSVRMPSSIDVATATNHGRPIVVAKPDHPVSRSLRELATTLAPPTPDHDVAEQAHEKKRGLFRGRKH